MDEIKFDFVGMMIVLSSRLVKLIILDPYPYNNSTKIVNDFMGISYRKADLLSYETDVLWCLSVREFSFD